MLETFMQRHTRLQATALVPEIKLALARDPHAIFIAADERGAGAGHLPLWAFAWPGGQALARYLLDQPGVAQDRRVLDIGAGSGIAAIAAAKAGARTVLAADVDPSACGQFSTMPA